MKYLADPPGVDDVVEYAVDTLHEWMPPYETSQDRPQDRVTVLATRQHGLDVQYERVDRSAPDCYPPKRFRIHVTAEEIR